MTEAKPLHVQVAEALGCKPSGNFCNCPGRKHSDGYGEVRDYKTDWSATGPLIEEHRLTVRPAPGGGWAARKDSDVGVGQEYLGATPLIAACLCLKAGKLEGA